MSDQQQVQHPGYQAQQHGQQAGYHAKEGMKSLLPGTGGRGQGQTGSKLLAVATLFPVGGILLTLSGLTLAATVIGLAIATPLFVIFSPVLVPAAIAIGLAVTGFATSGAFGITALTSLWGLVNHLRGTSESPPQTLEYARRRMGEGLQQVGQKAGEGLQHVGQKTKETGQQVQSKAGQDKAQDH